MFSIRSSLSIKICFLLFIFILKINAQQPEPAKSNITEQRLWMLILPGTYFPPLESPLEQTLAGIVADIAWESGRFEVFDWYEARKYIKINDSRKSQFLQVSDIINAGDSLDCDEVLIIDLVNFTQVGVPPAEDDEEEDRNILEQIVDGIFSSDSDDYSDNIYTRIEVQFRNIDLLSKKELDRFKVNVSHTGGNKAESEEQAVQNFKSAVNNELRMLYQLVSEVVAVDGTDLSMKLGSNLGISRNTLFEITEPDVIKKVGDDEVFVPGEPVGIVCVGSVGDTVNKSLVLRQWKAIEPGYYAYEFNKNVYGIQVYFLPPFPKKYMYIGAQFHYSPLSSFDFGGGLRYSYVTDSYDEKDHGLGFGVFAGKRLASMTSMIVMLRVGVDLDIPFKKDDDGRTVNSAVLSGTLGISGSLMLSKKSDIEINFGYRFSTKSSEWTYTEEEENYDAYWIEAPPEIDLSGFMSLLGINLFFFSRSQIFLWISDAAAIAHLLIETQKDLFSRVPRPGLN